MFSFVYMAKSDIISLKNIKLDQKLIYVYGSRCIFLTNIFLKNSDQVVITTVYSFGPSYNLNHYVSVKCKS